MDGADGDLPANSGGVGLEKEMRAFFPGGLEDHAGRIKWIIAAIITDAVRIDHEDIKLYAASSAAHTDHAG